MNCCVGPCTRDADRMLDVEATFDMPIKDELLVHAEALAGVRGLYGVRFVVGICAGHADLLGIPLDMLDEVPV